MKYRSEQFKMLVSIQTSLPVFWIEFFITKSDNFPKFSTLSKITLNQKRDWNQPCFTTKLPALVHATANSSIIFCLNNLPTNWLHIFFIFYFLKETFLLNKTKETIIRNKTTKANMNWYNNKRCFFVKTELLEKILL